jgi:hypothetical protein
MGVIASNLTFLMFKPALPPHRIGMPQCFYDIAFLYEIFAISVTKPTSCCTGKILNRCGLSYCKKSKFLFAS